jgi:hypothetical protein
MIHLKDNKIKGFKKKPSQSRYNAVGYGVYCLSIVQSNTACNRLNIGLALKHTDQLLLLRVVCVCCLIADVVTQD